MTGSIDERAICANHDHLALAPKLGAQFHDVVVCTRGKADLHRVPARAGSKGPASTRAGDALAPASIKNHPHLTASKALSQRHDASLLLDLPPMAALAATQNHRVQQVETIDQVKGRHPGSRGARAPSGGRPSLAVAKSLGP